jgi:hypothetical protein
MGACFTASQPCWLMLGTSPAPQGQQPCHKHQQVQPASLTPARVGPPPPARQYSGDMTINASSKLLDVMRDSSSLSKAAGASAPVPTTLFTSAVPAGARGGSLPGHPDACNGGNKSSC